MYPSEQKIIDLIKPHIPPEILQELLLLLNDFDTEAKVNFRDFARSRGYLK